MNVQRYSNLITENSPHPALLCEDGCSDFDHAPMVRRPSAHSRNRPASAMAVSKAGLFSALMPSTARELFEDQSESLNGLRRSVANGHKRVMLMSATGSGKTVIGANIIRGALRKRERLEYDQRKKRSVYFVAPKKDLVPQTARSFKEEGIHNMGLLGGGYRQGLDEPVLVTTWQSMKNLDPLDIPDIVIIDEAHHLPEFLRKLMKDPAWEKVLFIGLSATPGTPGLGKYFTDLVVGGTTETLTPKGRLAPFRIFVPEAHLRPDLSNVRTLKGDWHEAQAADAMSKKELIADTVETWLRRGEGRPSICFAMNRAHAMKLEEAFQKSGITTGYIDMYVENDERDEIAAKSKSGEIQIVFNVNCLTTGTDWPWISCLILCRPTQKSWTYVQIIGRALRVYPGKADAIILDHSVATMRFIKQRAVSSIYKLDFDFSLDDGSDKRKRSASAPKERKEPVEKECKCGYLKPAGVRKCPACGFEPKPQTDIVHIQGELSEVGGGSVPKWDMKTKREWYGMLLTIAYERQSVRQKERWTANKYHERFSVWPRGMDPIFAVPTAECRGWVRSRDIAFAKSRKAA